MRPLTSIINEDLPLAHAEIFKTANEIEHAANYCHEAYVRSRNRNKSLNETLNFAAESLEKLAINVDNLSKNFLNALDQQNEVLNDMTDNVSRLKLFVNAHREKVSRKAIGTCTVEKSQVAHSHDFQPEVIQKYIRRPIDYNVFDGIGFGAAPLDRIRKKSEPIQNAQTAAHGSMVIRRSSAAVPPIYDRQNSMLSRTVGPKSGTEYAAMSIYNTSNAKMGQTGTINRNVVPNYGQGRWSGQQQGHELQQNQPHLSRKSSNSSGDVAGYASRNTVMASSQSSQPNTGAIYVANTNPPPVSQAKVSPIHQQQQQYVIQTTGNSAGVTIGHSNAGKIMLIQQQTPGHVQPIASQQQPIRFLRQQSEALPNQTILMPARPGMPMQRQHSLTNPSTSGNILIARPTNSQEPLIVHDLSQMNIQANQVQPGIFSQQQSIDNNLRKTAPSQLVMMDGSVATSTTAMLAAQANQSHLHLSKGQIIAAQAGMKTKKPTDPIWVPEYYLEKVETLYEYSRDKDDELTFHEGETIYVIKKNEDGWWEGIMAGTTGLFPGNYVQPIN